jgi:SWI/SNF-related matrix-associated actin-dependent regulator of chromatin subfamily A member 5
MEWERPFVIRLLTRNRSFLLSFQGKTLQTISLFSYLKETEQATGPSLVICPLSVLSSWCNELNHWAPHLKFLRLHSSSPEEQESQRKQLADHGHELDVVLTTYEMAKVPVLHSLFQRLHFHYLVLDEGHKIKGHTTQIAQAVRKIHSENKLLLTGTPLQNNLVELWSLLEFLYPEVFTTSKPFEDAFSLAENHVDTEMLCKAQQVLDLFMLRRLKARVEKLLPEKLETKVYCPLSQTQIFWYKAILLKDIQALCKFDGEEKTTGQSSRNVLENLFMQLRKCSQHPFLFDGAEKNVDSTSLEELIGASGKLAVLDMLLRSLCQKGHRAVLFSQFTMVLDIVEDYCRMRGWNYARFDGSTPRAKRTYLVNQFNATDSPFFLFLMSTKSGGMGLNLQSADTCILMDSDWNPQNDLQAMARVHRIGQTKTVHVYRLITAGTVEERIVERAEKKLLLDQTVNREKGAEDTVRNLSAKELLKDIKFGCAAIFGENSNNELPSLEDIGQITNRARTESDSVGKLKGGVMKVAATFDAEKELSASHQFGGVDFRKIREEQERKKKKEIPKNLKGIEHLWREVSQIKGRRVVKNRIIMVDGMKSGYGSASVPVLASNNYDLQHGESSVFDRELSHQYKKKSAVPAKKKRAQTFENQDHCQFCLDGGSVVLCRRCPVSVHLSCCGIEQAKDFQSCPHHKCVKCHKNGQNAGGLLYPCAVCPDSYCEDCLPTDRPGLRIIGPNDRFEALGYNSTKLHAYIHCSKECEMFASRQLKWRPGSNKQVCPEELDMTLHFGAKIEADNKSPGALQKDSPQDVKADIFASSA